MGLLDFLKQKKIQNVQIVEQSDEWKTNTIGSIEIPDKLTDTNAFVLANTVAEIYHPIDFLADRGSKLRFFIADKNGNEIENTELNRFINNINPFYTFSDLMYQSIFCYLSEGYIPHYVGVGSAYKKVNANSISRIDVLNPSLLDISEYSNISLLKSLSINDFIKQIEYKDGVTTSDRFLDIEKFRLYNYDMTRRTGSVLLSNSPLFHATRSINNLLATYSARYNVYVNNGAAGYLSKKSTAKTDALDEALNPSDREAILKDINNRNGITGNRHLWGISSVPLEFVNTLADIQKLMPFEETLEDSIKIAAVYQLPSGLVARKDQSTYNNQEQDEKKVWENTLMSVVDSVCSYFTKSFVLDKVGYQILADYSTVSALQMNEDKMQDVIKKKLDNLKIAKELNPELDVKLEINKLYGTE